MSQPPLRLAELVAAIVFILPSLTSALLQVEITALPAVSSMAMPAAA